MTLLFESCIYSDDETIQSVDRPRTGPRAVMRRDDSCVVDFGLYKLFDCVFT